MSEIKAFVAGATGLTGRSVVESLCRRGCSTVAHVRPDSSRLGAWRDRFAALGAEVDSTPWDADAMQARFAALRPTHVFSLLGTTRKRMKAEGGDYAAIDYGLTALLIDALVGAEVPARFVYLSSIGVSPDTTNTYLKARAMAEAKLQASGLQWIIARPSIIVGDRDEERPLESVSAGVADFVLGMGRIFGAKRFAERYRSTPAPTLAEGIVRHGLGAEPNRIVEGHALRDG